MNPVLRVRMSADARLLWPVGVLLLGFLLSGCSTMRAGAHFDDTANFGDFRSFAWMSDDPLILGENQPMPMSPLAKKLLINAIEDELQRKSYVQVADPAGADFVVSFTVGTRERIDATTYPAEYGGEWGWHPYGHEQNRGAVMHRSYTEGTLGVDIFDGVSKEPIWHGWAARTIVDADRDNPSPAIREAVRALFKRFPPDTES